MVPTNLLTARQARLYDALSRAGLDALVVNPGPSLTYFTGLHLHLSERPSLAILSPNAPVVLVLPELEAGKADSLSYPHNTVLFGDDPGSWQDAYRQAARTAGVASLRTGVEALRLRVLELRLLEQAAPHGKFLPGDTCVASLRMIKDESEVSAMRQAVRVAQLALLSALENFETGMSEQALAAELTVQLLRHGSQPELSFAPIVASGPNSANPHAFPTDRHIQSGDLLVVDWGAMVDGYISDLTRTFVIGGTDPELVHIARVVREANSAGRAQAAPGVTAASVDAAARQVIEQAGYGEYFIHRTGHGIGMEVHEDPYIRSGNELVLAPGMTFTVEPGIYLPGRGGVRIEDNVVITPSGAETLSDLPRELISIS